MNTIHSFLSTASIPARGIKTAIAALAISVLLASCASSGMLSSEPEERRVAVLEMREEVLQELYDLKPDTRVQIGSAPGYAVFSNANINLILASFGGGVGVVRDNETGTDTFMRMGEVGFGIGAGVRDFRAVFVFHTEGALERFIDVGIGFGGQADAAAKAGDLGGAVGGEASVDNVTVYQITQSGLALQATVKGTRYWKDGDLN